MNDPEAIFQEPSPAWRKNTPQRRFKPSHQAMSEPACAPQLKRALAKISTFAVDNGVTMWEMIDYLRTEMVLAGSTKCPYGEKKRVASELGVHRNTISRIRRAE